MQQKPPESRQEPFSRPSGARVALSPVQADTRPLDASLVPPASLDLDRPVFGIDPSTVRVSVACVLPHGQGLGWDTLSLPRFGTDNHRFHAAYRDLVPWLAELQGRWGTPTAVYCEQPFAQGRNVRPSSQHMVGVVLTALGAVFDRGTELCTCNPSEWKAGALGKGHGFAKPDEYAEWARAAGYTGVIEDECAALGVATFAGVRAQARALAA